MKKPVANPHAAVAHFPAMTRSIAEPAARPRRMRAFTLIELLVVIAIIGILAALTVGVLPGISQKRTRSAVLAQMTAIQTAINTYKQKQGFYPPDNTNNATISPPQAVHTGHNPLFHELTGQSVVSAPPGLAELGVAGIVNSGVEVQNYFPGLKTSAYQPLPSMMATGLVVNAKGPNGEPNFWHYNSSRPTHNADSYDLWAEVSLGGETIIIGNWK